MPPNGVEEWRARIGNWENRKLRWYQVHSGSRRRVPLNLGRVISKAPQLCLFLLLSFVENVASGIGERGKDALSTLGRLAGRCRCCASSRSLRARATPLFSLFLAVSLLLIVAGDVETNPGPISDELLVQVDNSELTDNDIYEVSDAVYTLCARWSHLCFSLKLPLAEEEAIAKTYSSDPRQCLKEVLKRWLRKNYEHRKYGHPSWRSLVRAVGDPNGGNDCALAETIGKNHAAVPAAVLVRNGETSSKPRPDPRHTNKLCSDFAEMLAKVANILDRIVDMGMLVDFLDFYSHPLYPEKRYIDPKIYKGATTTKGLIKCLFPQYINFMHYFLLEDIVEKFGCGRAKEVLHQYTEGEKRSRKRKLIDQPDPITDEETEQFHGTKKLKVEVEGETSDMMVEKIGEVQEGLERATGISRKVMPYASHDPGCVLFTFLIPENISHILHELNSEDLAILAKVGVMRLEIDELVIKSIQKFSTVNVGEAKLETAADNSESTKAAGLKYYLQEKASEMTPERYSYLCRLLDNTDRRKHHEICSDKFLQEFANYLQDWISLAPYFGIQEWQIEELVHSYPDESEQKHVALLCWKRMSESTATFYSLLESLILHGTIGEVEALLQRLGEGPAVFSTSQSLKQWYLDHDSWQQWREIPNLMEFDQRLGELKSGASKELKEMDYSTCYYNMIEDSSVITPVSVKSLVNKITHLAAGRILIKGAPNQGKSFLLSKLCHYWASGYGIRRFTLMFWVDCLSFQNREIGLRELLLQLLQFETQNVTCLCTWIENRLGQDVIFILDGYNCQQAPEGDIFQNLASQKLLQKSVILITSTCTPYVSGSDDRRLRRRARYSPQIANESVVNQYELLTLTDTQIFKQVLRFFHESPSKAEDFLLYLTLHPDMKLLAASPVHLYTLLLVYNNVVDIGSCEPPATWTQLFTNATLFLLKSTFPAVLQTGKQHNCLNNLPSDVQSFLYDLSTSAFENLSSKYPHHLSLSQQVRRLLDHKSGFALVHHYSTPLFCKGKQYFHFFSKLLQQFLAAVHVARLPLSEQTKLMEQMKELSFMWQFYAGLNTSEPFERFQVLKERYCKGITKALANCAFEANWVINIPSNIESHILTAADIHHLKVASDMSFTWCCFGKAALYQLGKQAHAHTLSGDRQLEMRFDECVLPNDELGSLALPLQKLSLECCDLTSTGAVALGEALKKSKTLEILVLSSNSIESSGVASLSDALRVNQTLKELNLYRCGVTSTGAIALGEALQENNSLQELDLGNNSIDSSGAASLSDALRVNQTLRELNLYRCGVTSTGAIALGEALQENNSLQKLELGGNGVSDDGARSMAATLKVNNSLKTLSLYNCHVTSAGAIALGEALQENNSLEELDLWNNSIDSSGATSLSDALRVNQTLRELNLWNNSIDSSGAASLSDALRVNQTLRELNVELNNIDDNGARSLGDGLRANHSLETLKLGYQHPRISWEKQEQLTQEFGSRIVFR